MRRLDADDELTPVERLPVMPPLLLLTRLLLRLITTGSSLSIGDGDKLSAWSSSGDII